MVLGDAFSAAMKVVTDTTETVVQKTPIGKVAEAFGVRVQENIHDNGLNTTVKGPLAKMATGFQADKMESKLKVKTSGNDFGAKGSAAAKDGDVTIASADAGVDKNGAYAKASVGAMVNSGFEEISTITDVNKLITNNLKKLIDSNRGRFVKIVQDETGLDVEGFVKKILDEILNNSPMGRLSELLLRAKGGNGKIYLDLGFSVTAGTGATLKAGMEEEVEVKGKKQTFKMYQFGGKFAVAGVSAGTGYSKMGKTFDGFDEGVYLVASGSGGKGVMFSISIGLIITTNVSSEMGEAIALMKKADVMRI
eukprot:CAMPEP_0184861980 /NCGR_PEP_ID=MMETSP0580-20130426/6534_1 /TAXON_ID=1118495 /ORGANISM="Dactyliosolen fragilissimus" /LENGTH=307 /DNA_ID=CAMNT_0027359663 /DNA_START=99 /DNA_END=1022 /DNA_ORIENTATION=-